MNLLLFNKEEFVSSDDTLVRISGDRFRHCMSVLKVKPGDELKVGMISGLMGEGVVEGISSEYLDLRVDLKCEPPHPLPCTLIVALPRPKCLKKVIECAVSLGIKKIFIINSFRVDKSYWTTPQLSAEKLFEFVTNGLMQARDTTIVEIETRRLFKPFVEDELPAIARNSRALVAHPYSESGCPQALCSSFTLAIGPEGGFIPYEIESFNKIGFETVSLGQRILRVEYALPVLVGRLMG